LPIENRKSKIENRKSPRRSVLFMPGDSLRKISKAAQMDVDSIVMDLEDGVALNRKDEARRTVVEALQTLDFGRSERLVRLNSPDTELFTADVGSTIEARPDGYVIPKVETARQVQTVSYHLGEAEQKYGWPSNSVRLIAIIETALGVMNLKEIAQSGPRLEALMFGAEDLAGDIGAQRTPAGWEVFYARSAVVTAAAAYGLQAIDMIFIDLQDMAGLEAEATLARQLGYDGKMAIHPRQVELINRVFAPTPEEIAQARRVIEAHEAHQASGTGAFELDGKMVDRPIVRAAERVLARARDAGLLD
jgi:citrate lyase subunit beta-like protein